MGGAAYERQLQQVRDLQCDGSGYDPRAVDRSRRKAHLDQSRKEYSAKLPNRFSSVDYVSQW